MNIEWVNDDNIPVADRRGSSFYVNMANKLRENPGKWAVWNEYIDGGRYYAFRKRFPDLEFRKESVPPRNEGSKAPRYKAYARYVAS